MIETQEVQVGEHVYKLTTLSVSKALSVFARLTKTCGPAMAEVLEAAKVAEAQNGEATLLDIDIGHALKTLISDLNEADIVFLKDSFVGATQIPTDEGNYVPLRTRIEDRYAGNLSEFFEWLIASIKYNYPDFLAVFERALKKPSVKASVAKNPISSP